MEPGDGSGIALAIVKEIAEPHSGSARIKPSEIGAKILPPIPLGPRSPAE